MSRPSDPAHAGDLQRCASGRWSLLLPVYAQQRDVRLLDAVKRRDQKAFAALLRAKADVNAAQPDGATALAWAVHLGERRMAEALLDAGAKANTADEYGETPVTLAAANGDAALVQRLLAAGGNAARGALERRDGGDDLRPARAVSRPCGQLVAARRRCERGGTARRSDRADVGRRRRPRAMSWPGLIEMGANVNAASRDRLHAARLRRDQGRRAVDQDAARRPAPIRTSRCCPAPNR